MPIREDKNRKSYNRIPKEVHLKIIQSYLQDANFAMEVNLYPYKLPIDVDQYIIWLRERETSQEDVSNFIARTMKFLDLKIDDIILFERSQNAESKLVKGTIPQLRHIHMWMRKKDKNK